MTTKIEQYAKGVIKVTLAIGVIIGLLYLASETAADRAPAPNEKACDYSLVIRVL